MNLIRITSACVLALCAWSQALAQPNVNIIVNGEVAPGVYGRVEIGNAPPPIYLHVPPGHARKWSKHCRRYNACGRPVYFVRSAEYEPNYRRDDHRDDHRDDERRQGHGRGHGPDHRK